MVGCSTMCLLALLALTSALQPGVPMSAARSKPLIARTGLQQSPVLVAASDAVPPPAGTSVTTASINLAKNIVGSGVLALAAGVAAFSGTRVALIPSVAMLLALGAISGYTFSIIARVGDAVGADTYRDTWAKVFGEKTAFIPDTTVVFMTAVAGLAYAIIIGDSFSSMAALAKAPAILCKVNSVCTTDTHPVLSTKPKSPPHYKPKSPPHYSHASFFYPPFSSRPPAPPPTLSIPNLRATLGLCSSRCLSFFP